MKNKEKDFIKANRRGSREADYLFRDGWIATDRPHKNKKKYNRKKSDQDWKYQT
jgi:hypothetical protein